MKWKRAYWWLKIAFYYFIIDAFCIEWNQKLRLNIRDNTHTQFDQLYYKFELLVTLICVKQQKTPIWKQSPWINSMTLVVVVDITHISTKYVRQFVSALLSLYKIQIYFYLKKKSAQFIYSFGCFYLLSDRIICKIVQRCGPYWYVCLKFDWTYIFNGISVCESIYSQL